MRYLILILISSSILYSQEWNYEEIPDFTPRHHPITFTLDGMGYVTTGSLTESGVVFENDFFQYNPETKEWTQLPDFPGAARGFSYGDTWNGKAYLGFGGSYSLGGINFLNDLWSYDPVTETWEELPSCPCSGRLHPAFVISDGMLYVGLGNNPQNLNDFWKYDIENRVWTQIDDLPGPPRHHPFYFSIGDTVYAGLGHGNGVIYNDWYKYKEDNGYWEQMDNMPAEPRVAGTQFNYQGKGYVLSGQGADHVNFDTGEFYEYTPDTDSWERLTDHPGSGRWAPGSFLIDNKVHFLGGLSNDSLENSMITYEIEKEISSVELSENEYYVRGNELNIESELGANVQVYDILGNIVYEENKPGRNTINLESRITTRGAYIIKLSNYDGVKTIKYIR